MDETKIAATLGLPPETDLQLTGLDMELWGQTLRFTGIAGEIAFQLLLMDCREIRWQLYAHLQIAERPAFPPTMIADLSLGKDQHRQPLQLLTDYFGLTVRYGTLQIKKLTE